MVAAGLMEPNTVPCARPTASASAADVRNMRVRTTSSNDAPACTRAAPMISRQRAAWASASSTHDPSGHTGAVPDTTTRLPTTTARENPMVGS